MAHRTKALVLKNPAFDAAVRQQLTDGMQELMVEAREQMNQDYTQAISPPTSSRGQFPHIQTTQLVTNIAGVVELDDITALIGVKGVTTDEPKLHQKERNIGGLAALFLQTRQGRKGLDDSFLEHRSEIVAAFARGARLT